MPILVNTSFNVRGEPIVNSIEDAYKCFLTTELDYLVCGNFILNKKNQIKKLYELMVKEGKSNLDHSALYLLIKRLKN